VKKIAINLSLLTCIVTGVLHSNFRQIEHIENISAEQSYTIPAIDINPQFDPFPF
jgi:hypothetical protein